MPGIGPSPRHGSCPIRRPTRPLVGGALIIAGAIVLAIVYVMSVGEPQVGLMVLLFGPALLGGGL